MTRTNVSVVVLASAAVLLCGCGGSSRSGVAQLPSSTSGSSDGASTSSTTEGSAGRQQKMVAYSQCMRSHGVPEFPEPTEGHLLIHSSDHNGQVTGVDPGSTQFKAAQKVCGKLLPNGGAPTTAEQAKVQEGALKFSQCMRTHGVPNFPDPKVASGGRVALQITGGAGGIDPNSPQFKAAQKTCQSDLPGPPGAKGSAPGGGEVSSGGGPEQSSDAVIAP